MSIYNQDSDLNKNNSYSFEVILEEESCDSIDDTNTYLCHNFRSIATEKYLEAIREIEKFTYLKHNWDGYGAIPLTQAVAEKSKSFVENLNYNLFEDFEFVVKPTPYSTLVIDWYKQNNLFSLEIGKDSIAYFTDGEKLIKEELELNIASTGELKKAVKQVEEDLYHSL